MRPLPRTFMLASMLGLLISGVYTVSGRLDPTWGFTFMLISGIMFIASMLSITPTEEDLKKMENPLVQKNKSVIRRKKSKK